MNRRSAVRYLAGFAAVAAGTRPWIADAASAGAGVSPAEALERLKAGNARFVEGAMANQSGLIERREALTGHQAPFASILSCSDSRVPPELVFDQHIGDLFVMRNAGNFIDDAILGTAEYGFAQLGVQIIVVIGHDACGAISASYDAFKAGDTLPPHLNAIAEGVSPAVERAVHDHHDKAWAITANARDQAANFSQRSPELAKGVAAGKLTVVPAVYRLATGRIEFLSAT